MLVFDFFVSVFSGERVFQRVALDSQYSKLHLLLSSFSFPPVVDDEKKVCLISFALLCVVNKLTKIRLTLRAFVR